MYMISNVILLGCQGSLLGIWNIMVNYSMFAGCRGNWRVPWPHTAATEETGWVPGAVLHCPVPSSCSCLLLLLLPRQPSEPGPLCSALHSLSFLVSILQMSYWRDHFDGHCWSVYELHLLHVPSLMTTHLSESTYLSEYWHGIIPGKFRKMRKN